MSDAPLRTKISGGFSLVSQDGSCKVVVDDGSGRKPDEQVAAAKAQEEEAQRQAAYRKGAADAEKRLAGEIAALKARIDVAENKLPESLNAYFAELEAQMRGEIVELAIKAAEAVACAELERRDATAEILRQALSPLIAVQNVKVHVNPAAIAKGFSAGPGVQLQGDPRLNPGEVMVESPQGFIDGTVEGRLRTLKDSILKSLSGEASNA